MPELREYYTVGKSGVGELTEKKSRFIGYAAPVSDEEAALAFIREIKRKHNDARHNCFAYRLKSGVCRYSDDGEPQGTAGQPILEVLSRGEITDCAVVVTRYFGGVLLGTGGLSRAYSAAAKLALESAETVHMRRMMRCTAQFDYALYGSIQTMLARHDAVINASDFADTVTLGLFVDEEQLAAVSAGITELSAGRAVMTTVGYEFVKKTMQK